MIGSMLPNRILVFSFMICIAVCSAKTLSEQNNFIHDVSSDNMLFGIQQPVVYSIVPNFVLTTVSNSITIKGYWGSDAAGNVTIGVVQLRNYDIEQITCNATILEQTAERVVITFESLQCVTAVFAYGSNQCLLFYSETGAPISFENIGTCVDISVSPPATMITSIAPIQVLRNQTNYVQIELNGAGLPSLLQQQLLWGDEGAFYGYLLPNFVSTGDYYVQVDSIVTVFSSDIPITVVDSCAGLLSPVACSPYSQCVWCASTAQCLNNDTVCTSEPLCQNCLGNSTANVWCANSQRCQQSLEDCYDAIISSCAAEEVLFCNSGYPFVSSSCAVMYSDYVYGRQNLPSTEESMFGWCWDNNQCMNGNVYGPFVGSCRQWAFNSLPCNALFSWTEFTVVIVAAFASLLCLTLLLFCCGRHNWVTIVIPKTFHRVLLGQQFVIVVSSYGMYVSFLVKKVFNIVTFCILVFPYALTVSDTIPFTAGIVVLLVMVHNLFVVIWLLACLTGYIGRIPQRIPLFAIIAISFAIETVSFILMVVNIIPYTLNPASPRCDLCSGSGIDYGQIIAIAVSGVTSLTSHVFAYQLYNTVRSYHLLISSATQHLIQFTDNHELENVVTSTYSAATTASRVIYGTGEHVAFHLKRAANLLVGVASTVSLYFVLYSGFTTNIFDHSYARLVFTSCSAALCVPFVVGIVIAFVFRNNARYSARRFASLRIVLGVFYVISVFGQISALTACILIFRNITLPYFALLSNINSAIIAITADVLCLAYEWSLIQKASVHCID